MTYHFPWLFQQRDNPEGKFKIELAIYTILKSIYFEMLCKQFSNFAVCSLEVGNLSVET